MATLLVGTVLSAILGLAGYSMVKDKKAGKHPICGGSCRHCPHHLNGSCH